MLKDSNLNNSQLGRLTQLHMAAVEEALYSGEHKTTEELRKLLTRYQPYSQARESKVSTSTVQKIIAKLRNAYKDEYKIPAKESIRVVRSGGIPKYVLGEKARSHLLFPQNIFYNKTDRDKLNLLLRVGEYFSLPIDAFLTNEKLLKEGAEELLGNHIELRMQPFQSKVFADVFNAVEKQQVITFRYEALAQPHNPSPSDNVMATPYYLKSYANKWYLIGHVRKSPNRWTVFALDRMSEVKICEDIAPYFIDTKVIENFYENVIGFFVPPNPDGSFPRSEKELDIKHITIIMKNERVAFFLEKNPIHKSQRRSNENILEFHINCLDNIHLYQELMRILDGISWIEPPVVRNRLLSKLEEAQKVLKA